jgi:hypothetical protein
VSEVIVVVFSEHIGQMGEIRVAGTKLIAARKELAFAKTALDNLKVASGPDDEDIHWKEFIGRLTRFWNKTESALKGDPKFYNSPHVKRVKAALKSDELIRYLSQARHADEHRHDDTTGVMPGGFENVSTTDSSFPTAPRLSQTNSQGRVALEGSEKSGTNIRCAALTCWSRHFTGDDPDLWRIGVGVL